MMNLIRILLLLLPVVALAAGPSGARPNVILILADDIGYGDLGCYGALPQHVRTPNLDRLAGAGLRFTDAHAPSSVCSPSRYALLTGEYGFRNRKAWSVLPGDAPLAIAPGQFTLPSMFRAHGYVTGLVGKWHLGLGGESGMDWNGDIKPGPLEVGFDSAFYMPSTGDRVPTVLIRNHRVLNLEANDPIRVSYRQKIGDEPTGRENPALATVLLGVEGLGHDATITRGVSRIGWMTGGKTARWKDEMLMDQLTDEAVRFIRENLSKPFFLYFATHGIHEPRVPASRFVGRSGAGVYGDQILELDDSVGRVLKTLDELKLADNTLVLFSSDNGGSPADMNAYQYGARTNLNGHLPNGRLRGGKYTVWEGGTRVPLIARWSGYIPSGAESPALVSLVDLTATLAGLISAPLPPQAAPDSFDVSRALLGNVAGGRKELVEHQSGETCALRVENWKWIDGQLYDLSADLSEQRNLAREQPERAQAMAARLKVLCDAPEPRVSGPGSR